MMTHIPDDFIWFEIKVREKVTLNKNTRGNEFRSLSRLLELIIVSHPSSCVPKKKMAINEVKKF